MVHRIVWRVGSPDALAFWTDRLGTGPVFADPEGLEHELVAIAGQDAPLTAHADDIPAEFALQGFHAVRAYSSRSEASRGLLEALGFTEEGAGSWRLAGDERHALYHYDPPPAAPGLQGAGTIHHVAWSAADDAELTRFREVAAGAGAHPTPIIDRQYFHSVYFREPSAVLFELASRDIGFAVDEPLAVARPRAHAAAAARAPPRPPRAQPHPAAVIARVVRDAAGEQAGTIVLLHGRGTDEHDLLPLLGVLDPKRRFRGITLGAPLALPGSPGKHWYAVHRVGWPDPATFDPTYAELTAVLDDELGLDWSRTVVGGFSRAA